MKKPAALLTALALLASGCAISYQRPLSASPTPGGVKFPTPSPPHAPTLSPSEDGQGCEPSPSPSRPVKRDLRKLRKELGQKLKKELKQLKVGVSRATPRLSFWNPYTHEFEGFEIDLVMEIAKKIFGSNAKNKVVFFVVPFTEKVNWLAEEKVDILAKSMTITCQRAEKLDFSNSYLDTAQTMLVRAESTYESINGLRGKRVCSGESTVSIDNVWRLRGDMVPVTAPVTSDCMLLLQQGQVEAISSDVSILLGLKDMDNDTKLLTDSPSKVNRKCGSDTGLSCTWFSSGSYGFAFQKGGDKDLLSFVNLVLDEMRSKGRWKEIHDKWLPEHPDKSFLSTPPPGGHN